MNASSVSRRGFLQQGLAGTAFLAAGSYARVYGANEKLRVVSVGTGGKGWDDLTQISSSPRVDVVALCDIDESEPFMGRAAKKFPMAKRFTDYRKLWAEAKSYDAVIVSTPDHMHAPIALPAMHLGKHVFCQKPLTHTVYEARQMQLAAAKFKVVTQMGNQIQSHEAYRTAVRAVHAGAIGKVKEVHSWQAGALGWILADDRPEGKDELPTSVHWNDWLGVAPERPYKAKLYHSFNWRAWQDFSNGQLGDFGCHILDPVFMALNLTAPTTLTAEAPPINREVWTKWCTVRYTFPGTEHTVGKTLPLTWYDGAGKKPDVKTLGLPAGTNLPGSGSVLLGEKGILLIPHVATPQLFLSNATIEKVASVNHYTSWVDACRGDGKATSAFAYAGNLTETVLLGTIALRLPGTTLTWESNAMKLTGHEKAAGLLTKNYRKGWAPDFI